jgi:Divergent InlB B-repeat domain
VRAIVAAGWSVNDAAAVAFATTFDEQMLVEGSGFGDAVKRARRKAHEKSRSMTRRPINSTATPSFGSTSSPKLVSVPESLRRKTRVPLPREAPSTALQAGATTEGLRLPSTGGQKLKALQDWLDRRLAFLVALAALTISLPAASTAASMADGLVSVAVVGSGHVASSPAGIDCGSVCIAPFSLGSGVRLSASPASGSYLAGWSGDCVGSSETCDLIAEENAHVQAEFRAGSAPTPPVNALTVSYSGEGRVTSSPADIIDCGSNCWTSFSGGGHVLLNASPASGFVFDGWAGDCSGAGNCDVAVTGLRSVIAVFKKSSIPSGTSTLTITNNNMDRGTIQISWTGHAPIPCDDVDCTIDNVPNGIRVKVQPLPKPNTVVENYGGACAGTAQQCVVVLNENAGVTTSFQDAGALTTSFGLNLTRSAGGSIRSTPPGIDCGGDAGCKAAFKRNISVRLTANVASGYSFAGWSRDCSGTSACTLSMTVSRTVSASFRAARDTLRVVKSGRGIGTITSEPGGINCGDTCEYSFGHGAQVKLNAVANRRSRFQGWGGACSGTQPCALTVSAATEVTAAFDNCAASSFSAFNAVAKARAVIVRLSLADRATARVRLLRGRATLSSRTFANLSAGAKSLRIPVPRGRHAGKTKVEVRVKDICGRSRTLSRTVTLR